jgi:biopolymer transport protein ExbD
MGGRRKSDACGLDMTPMIDVVFQLIIFFIVTIKMDKDVNEKIELASAKHGPEIKEKQGMLVEVDSKGRLYMHGASLNYEQFRNIVRARYKRTGRDFDILVRGDKRTLHREMAKMMSVCTDEGCYKVKFIGIKEKKSGKRAFD